MKDPANFSAVLYDFEAFLEVEKNLAIKTRRAYVYDLERFADAWLKWHRPPVKVEKITTADIKRYLEFLRMDKKYKSTTLSRNIASIRIFFEFCVMQGLLETSPAGFIHNPKNPKKLPVFLVESELKRLLLAPEKQREAGGKGSERSESAFLAERDYAILITLGFTGMRLSELTNLQIRDISFERKNVRVMGKGSKERIIPLNDLVIKALEAWLVVRPLGDDDAVFLNRFHKRLSPRGVEKMVEKYVRNSGLGNNGKISPHKLRHTFATLLHVNGVDILEIQALLGHASITSTQVYTHASSEKLKSAVKKLETI